MAADWHGRCFSRFCSSFPYLSTHSLLADFMIDHLLFGPVSRGQILCQFLLRTHIIAWFFDNHETRHLLLFLFIPSAPPNCVTRLSPPCSLSGVTPPRTLPRAVSHAPGPTRRISMTAPPSQLFHLSTSPDCRAPIISSTLNLHASPALNIYQSPTSAFSINHFYRL